MAITVDWGTKVITIPKADTTLVQASPEVRSLNSDTFRLELKALEDDESGIAHLDTHEHSKEKTLSGVTYARFVEIINGYTLTFEDGSYAVTILGANTNFLDVKNPNSVSLLANNSAGLVNLNNILATASYQGQVWIDTVNGSAGTISGTNGIPSNPSDNIADALIIAANQGLRALRVITGTVTLAADLEDFDVHLDRNAAIDFGGFSVDGSEFTGGTITGTMTGEILAVDCTMLNVSGFTGPAKGCQIEGVTSIGVGLGVFYKCVSGVVGTGMPVIDMVGAGRTLSVRGYSGGVEVRNMSDATNVASLDFESGQLRLSASCTAGTAVVRGLVAPVEDNSSGTTVVSDGRLNPQSVELVRKDAINRKEVSIDDQELVLYDDDGTQLFTWALETDGGEPVQTAIGVQTKRAAPQPPIDPLAPTTAKLQNWFRPDALVVGASALWVDRGSDATDLTAGFANPPESGIPIDGNATLYGGNLSGMVNASSSMSGAREFWIVLRSNEHSAQVALDGIAASNAMTLATTAGGSIDASAGTVLSGAGAFREHSTQIIRVTMDGIGAGAVYEVTDEATALAPTATGTIGSDAWVGLTVGADYLGAGWAGSVAEVLRYNAALETAEVQQTVAYLLDKYPSAAKRAWTEERLMCVGDSLVIGTQSTTGYGFRSLMRDSFETLDIETGIRTISLVGPVDDKCLDHGGVTADIITDVNTRIAAEISASNPGVIVLLAGSNDCRNLGTTYNSVTTPAAFATLLATINTANPTLPIVVCTLPPQANPTHDANVDDFNSEILTTVIPGATSPITVVDLNSIMSAGSHLDPDGFHMNDSGYAIAEAAITAGVRAAVAVPGPVLLFPSGKSDPAVFPAETGFDVAAADISDDYLTVGFTQRVIADFANTDTTTRYIARFGLTARLWLAGGVVKIRTPTQTDTFASYAWSAGDELRIAVNWLGGVAYLKNITTGAAAITLPIAGDWSTMVGDLEIGHRATPGTDVWLGSIYQPTDFVVLT